MGSTEHHAYERPSRWELPALASGIIFVVLLIGAAMIAPMPPGPAGTAAENAEWFVNHRDSALLQVSLRGIAAVFQIVFIAGLASAIRRVQDGLSTLALLVFAGGIAHTLMLLASNAASATAAVVAGNAGVEPGVIRALQALGENLLILEAMPGGMLVGAASLAILQTGVAPRWVGWMGLILMPIYLVGAFAFEGSPILPVAFLAMIGELLWFLAASLTLTLRARRAPSAHRTRVVPA